MAKTAVEIHWIKPPGQLANAVKEYGDAVMVAVFAVAQTIASQAQNDMRTNAPWTDRTGNARSGLFSMAEQAANDVITIYFSHGHTVEYGKFLELSRGGTYAIIMPTMRKILPDLEKMLQDIFS